MWVGGSDTDTWISTIDPASEQVTRIDVGLKAPAWFARGTGDLWIATAESAVVRLDARTEEVTAVVRIPGTPVSGAVTPDGSVVIPDKERDTISVVDPGTNRVTRVLDAGPGAYFARVAFGSLWVTSYAGRDVWRFAV